jgi:catechol 2,3-dioxygenase-like lactoylglutathione lyase family enzyme
MTVTPNAVTAPRVLAGIHHVCLPVSNIERAADWFSDVLGLAACSTYEEDNGVTSVLLEHSRGAAVLLRADPVRAVAMSRFPAMAFTVGSVAELQGWAEHLSSVGVVHTQAAPAHLGWAVRLWGPDTIELRLTTPAPFDGAER